MQVTQSNGIGHDAFVDCAPLNTYDQRYLVCAGATPAFNPGRVSTSLLGALCASPAASDPLLARTPFPSHAFSDVRAT
jgi:hypothetical protein